MRLATKFIAILLLAMLALLGSYAWLAYRHEIATVEQRFETDVLMLGQGLRELVSMSWGYDGPERAIAIIDSVNRADAGVQLNWVWFQADAPPNHLPRAAPDQWPEILRFRDAALEVTGADGRYYQVAYLCVVRPGWPPGAVEISRPVTHREDARRDGLLRLLLFGGAALLLGGVLVLVLGDALVGQPLAQLLEKTRRIGAGELSGSVGLQRNDEFGELAEAIDAMCRDLESARQRVEQEHDQRLATVEQLRHADRLRTVGRLAAGIAHELGTPLNVVAGRAGLIASGRLSEEDVRGSAQAIEEETRRITRTVRQLLDFARQNTPHKSHVDVRELLGETLRMVEPLAQKQSVQLVLEDGGPAVAGLDAGQIRQVFSNLLINALQAMPEGGTVCTSAVSTRAHRPQAAAESVEPCVRIDVRDQGPGIPDEVLPQIFEPFFTTKDVGEGTGLGLSIAHGIVQEHGGWIAVDSRPGVGTCFTVFLPAENAACPDAS